ncbi:unnamed protein product [Leptosia nina]|uniref:Uncharacterized protein n=1 Tax=Leptosia nina TaxID=320188 RepID=A0AAV1IU93_9NEOP
MARVYLADGAKHLPDSRTSRPSKRETKLPYSHARTPREFKTCVHIATGRHGPCRDRAEQRLAMVPRRALAPTAVPTSRAAAAIASSPTFCPTPTQTHTSPIKLRQNFTIRAACVT